MKTVNNSISVAGHDFGLAKSGLLINLSRVDAVEYRAPYIVIWFDEMGHEVHENDLTDDFRAWLIKHGVEVPGA